MGSIEERMEVKFDKLFDLIADINKELKSILKIEERVGSHHNTLTRFGNDIDNLKSEVTAIKIQMAKNEGKDNIKKDYEKIIWRVCAPVITAALVGYISMGGF